MSHTQEPWANPYYSTEMSADKVDRVNAVLVPADKLAAMQDRIAELERFIDSIAPLGVIDCACCRKPTPVLEEEVDHICPECEIEGIKLKLAEQQAKYTIQKPVGYIRGYGVECLQGTLVNTVTGQTPLPSSTRITPYMETDSDIPLYAKPMAVSNVELTNLIAKADQTGYDRCVAFHNSIIGGENSTQDLLAKAKEEGRKEAVPEVGNIREVNLTGDFVVKLVFKSCRAASSFVEFIRSRTKPQGETP